MTTVNEIDPTEESENEAAESLNTGKLKKFAQAARRQLLEAVESKLDRVLAEGSLARRESAKAVAELESQIESASREQVIERIAYTWFNRFCALRFMDVNRYTPVGIVSPATGSTQPEILADAKQGVIHDDWEVDSARVHGLLEGSESSSDPQAEAYQLLLISACNGFHSLMPFLFEKIADYTELLIPDDLLSDNSILAEMRETLDEENCKDVEVIGWLYQFYISEKKDDVFAALKKGKKITPENIPAATQLFTPHWIVRYLVENSLGRLWMLNFPQSKLVEKMDYYITPECEVVSGEGLAASDVEIGNAETIKGGMDGDSKLQGSNRLAESHGTGDRSLSSDEGISEGGTIRAYESGAQGSGIDSVQHRRGAGSERDGGVSEFPVDRKRQSGGSGNAASNRTQPELFGSADDGSIDDDPYGNRQDAQRPNSKTELEAGSQGLLGASEDSSESGHQPLDPDYLRISSPEEIRICDPACGSGHMLTYAFDLLYAIYEEQGYQTTDIPRLILENNLYGVEIDQRAGALAAFALTMKAREKDRRFFTRKRSNESRVTSNENQELNTQNSLLTTQPNICVLENIERLDPEDFVAYRETVGEIFTDDLVPVVNQWEEADNFGSLIRPLVTDVSEVFTQLSSQETKVSLLNTQNSLLITQTHQKVITALRQADYLSPKYHVVVANPPYMGSKGMNAKLKAFMKKEFQDVKSDLFSGFVVRNTELALQNGLLGFMSPFVWMFIASYEKLRRFLINEKTISSLVQLEYSGFDGATVPICTFTIKNGAFPDEKGAFIRLSDFRGSANQAPKTLEAIRNPSCGWFYRASSNDIQKVPGIPIAYWISDALRVIFETANPLEDVAPPKLGMHTTDNNRFLRRWYEVDRSNIGMGMTDSDEAVQSKKRWFPYEKGGEFRKWYGNNDFVLNYLNDGEELKEIVKEKYRKADYAKDFTKERWDRLIEVWVLTNRDYFFLPGVTWSFVSSSRFGVRLSEIGHIFDVGGSKAFPDPNSLNLVLGFLCSKLAFTSLKVVNSSLNFQVGDIGKLPWLSDAMEPLRSDVDDIVSECVKIAKSDWDMREVSSNFSRHPLLVASIEEKSVAALWRELNETNCKTITQLKELEERNNRVFINSYNLTNEMTVDVPLDEITLNVNPHSRYDDNKSESELEALLLADTMREFTSYAVGCMLGRYSLDKPGLILANQGETYADYVRIVASGQGLVASDDSAHSSHQPLATDLSFLPDKDNVIPLLDGDWFTDDISERFKEFLKVTFGTEHYEENLTFLENALYPDNLTGKKRKTIRDYFLKEFYNHHIKLYKKRPIYWLFSSPKGTFNALIYMHRYRPDTVSTVLQYLRDFRDKLTNEISSLQSIADSGNASASDKNKALKTITKLNKDVKELEDYEKNTLFPLAQQQIEIDLDDGVKVNYNKFGKALKKVTGLTGK